MGYKMTNLKLNWILRGIISGYSDQRIAELLKVEPNDVKRIRDVHGDDAPAFKEPQDASGRG